MTTEIQAPYQLQLAQSCDQVMALQRYIQTAYRHAFNATIPHFLPHLLGLYRADGQLVGACGLNFAKQGPLYLEHYLPDSIEAAIQVHLGKTTNRTAIVEVGNLACAEPGHGQLMFAALCRLLCENGLHYVVFTGTAKLRNSFVRLHLSPVELANASASQVGEDAKAWGQYYQCQPKVMLGELAKARQVLANHSLLLHLLAPMPKLFANPTPATAQRCAL